MLVQYTTRLLNKLIKNLDVDSFCVDGVCYYSRCQENTRKCQIRHCKFNIFTNEEKCSAVTPNIDKEHINLEDNEVYPLIRKV